MRSLNHNERTKIDSVLYKLNKEISNITHKRNDLIEKRDKMAFYLDMDIIIDIDNMEN